MIDHITRNPVFVMNLGFTKSALRTQFLKFFAIYFYFRDFKSTTGLFFQRLEDKPSFMSIQLTTFIDLMRRPLKASGQLHPHHLSSCSVFHFHFQLGSPYASVLLWDTMSSCFDVSISKCVQAFISGCVLPFFCHKVING